MVLYLAAAVIGVAVIVYLVIHLAKSGSGNAASGTSTPGSTATAGGGAAAGQVYVLRQAASVGNVPAEQARGHPDSVRPQGRELEHHQEDGVHRGR